MDTKLKVGESLKEGAFALAKAHYASSGDDIASSIVERVCSSVFFCSCVFRWVQSVIFVPETRAICSLGQKALGDDQDVSR